METLELYSPEPFDSILDDSGDNGDVFTTISANRNIRYSQIYIEVSSVSGFIRPTVHRGYYSGDNLLYHTREYADISTIGRHVFEYDNLNDSQFVTYYITFEVVYAFGGSIVVDSMGVMFDDVIGTKDNSLGYSTNISTDINFNPLYKQLYTKSNPFTLYMNKDYLEEVLNIIEKPFYLVDDKSDCLDNSSDLLIESGISIFYPTSSSKNIGLSLNTIVGN